jgi:hypothetical protein
MAGMLLDTDVVIDFLRGQPAAVEFVKQHSGAIHLSTITVAELFSGVKGRHEHAELERFLALFPVLDVTAAIARAAGMLRQQFGPSHGAGLPDCLIAATAKQHGLKLQTLNIRHFPMLDSLQPPYEKN